VLWRSWGDDVCGYQLHAGHFFPEEAPEQTAEALSRFFTGVIPADMQHTFD
jgi:haloacetate dehalogenase